MRSKIMHKMEYVKLYWRHDFPIDPVVIIYEVDVDDERYATRLINIFADGRIENQEDKAWGYVTEAAVPTVEEFNTLEYGEEFCACLVSQDEFEKIWSTGGYSGKLYDD